MTVAAVGEIVATPTTHERVWGHGGASDSGPEADDPFLVDLSHFGVDQCVWMPGAAGNYLSVPDDPTFDIAGDLTLVGDVAAKDWTDGTLQYLLYKQGFGSNGGYRLWFFGNGVPILGWSDGSSGFTETATVAIPANNRERLRIAAELDVDNDSGAYEVKFWTSTDAGASWTQLGSTLTGASTTSIGNSSAKLRLGTSTSAGTELLGAAFHFAVHSGLLISDPANATAAVTFDASTDGPLDPDTDSGLTPEGHTVTLNRSGDATAETVDRSCLAFTGSEFLEFPDRDVLDAVGDWEFHLGAHIRTPGAASGTEMWDSGKSGTGHPSVGAVSHLRGDAFWLVQINDGDGNVSVEGLHGSEGEWGVLGGGRDSGILVAYVDGSSVGTGDVSGVAGDLSNANAKRFGARPDGGGVFNTRPVSWFAWITRVLTAAERADLAAWDGTVSTEPSWLRDSAKLYLNADDPEWAKAYRDNDEVLNLAIPKFATVTAVGAIP